MTVAAIQNANLMTLPPLRQVPQPTVADQVFDILQQRILTLELAPGTKISETDVATLIGVSRQPVREAFKRLAKLGFLHIRPQSGTTVTLISEASVVKSRFIRLALEVQTCRSACAHMAPDGLAKLSDLLDRQRAVIATDDRQTFHALDDAFHNQICVSAGVGFAWEVISENKAHMDRVRMLSLDTASQKLALDEHVAIFEALSRRDEAAAIAAITAHLSRILALVDRLKTQNHSWFTDALA